MLFKKEIRPSRLMVENSHPFAVEPSPSAAFEGPYPFLDDALRITGAYEGRGFSEVTGDFDQQGLSLGILQWCFGQGSLQRVILKPYLDKHGSIDKLGLFPGPVDVTANMSNSQAVSYVRRYWLKGTSVRPDWAKAWATFLTRETVLEIQHVGCYAVAKAAQGIATSWGFNSIKAFCFFFDIVTQNGSMNGVVKPIPSRDMAMSYIRQATKQNQAIWGPLLQRLSDEELCLFQAAYLRASKSRAQYMQDVFSRKGTIAFGRGVVHGTTWDFWSAVMPPRM